MGDIYECFNRTVKSMNEDEYQLIDMRNESEIAHGEIPGAIVIQADKIENK